MAIWQAFKQNFVKIALHCYVIIIKFLTHLADIVIKCQINEVRMIEEVRCI